MTPNFKKTVSGNRFQELREELETDPVSDAIRSMWRQGNVPLTGYVIVKRRHLNTLINEIMTQRAQAQNNGGSK